MEDWKYLRKLHLSEKHGVMKGIAIAVFVLMLIGLTACAVRCYLKKGCACCGTDEDYDEPDDDDFEDEDE